MSMPDNRKPGGTRGKNSHPDVNNGKRPRSCAVQKLYPAIKVHSGNQYYAQLLLESYAGAAGELTTINQYLYHHLRLKNGNREVAGLLECIATVEMDHLAMLGEIILALGGDPMFMGCPSHNTEPWWCSRNIYYGRGLCDMVAADIDAERTAIESYNHHIRLIEDKHVKALLTRIVEDEIEHLRRLQEVSRRYCFKSQD